MCNTNCKYFKLVVSDMFDVTDVDLRNGALEHISGKKWSSIFGY